MNFRLPSASVPLVLVLIAGLAATGSAAAADDGAFTETPTETDTASLDSGNESDRLASGGERGGVSTPEGWARDTATTKERERSESTNASTDRQTAERGLAETVTRLANDAFTDGSERDADGNGSSDDAGRDSFSTTLDADDVETLFGAGGLVSYVEAGPVLTVDDGSRSSTTPGETSLVAATDDAGDDTSPERDVALSYRAGSAGVSGSLPTEGLALGTGTGVLLLVAATRQSLLSGLSAGPALAAVVPTGALNDASDRLFRLFAPFRYSRYDDSDPLEHDRRREVFDVIEAKPGTYLTEVSDIADVPLSTARHHVRVLEREDLVASAKVRGKRRFYPDGAEEVELAAAMDDEPTAAVLDALARLGPCSVATLADELGRDSSTVTHHLQRLDDDDLVLRERDGRTVVNRLAPAARRVLGHESVEAGATAAPADD